jgi:flagellar basal-body rod modification protein FlgD
MSLLLAELQTQDPTAPMDTTAMVGQMVSLNQLDELMSIQSILQNSLGSGATGTTAPTGANQTTNSSGSATGASSNAAQSANSMLAATTAPFSNAQSTYSSVAGTTAPITSTQSTNGAN